MWYGKSYDSIEKEGEMPTGNIVVFVRAGRPGTPVQENREGLMHTLQRFLLEHTDRVRLVVTINPGEEKDISWGEEHIAVFFTSSMLHEAEDLTEKHPGLRVLLLTVHPDRLTSSSVQIVNKSDLQLVADAMHEIHNPSA